MTFRAIVVRALPLLLLASSGAAAQPAGDATEAPNAGKVAEMLRLAEQYGRILNLGLPSPRDYHDAATFSSRLFDARRTVAEIDRIVANASIFGASDRESRELTSIAARAHMHLALFEMQGLEFDQARRELDRGRALFDEAKAGNVLIEWTMSPDGAPGTGMINRYHLLSPDEFEAALASIAGRARQIPIRLGRDGRSRLGEVELTRSPAPYPGSSEEHLLKNGEALLRDAAASGRHAVTVPLPPGAYRLRAGAAGEIDRSFIVPETSKIHPLLFGRARFSARVEPEPASGTIRFFLNGIEVTDLSAMPYGVYRIEPDPDHYQGLPQEIRFVEGNGIAEKTHEVWTIYVKAGETAVLHFDRLPLSKRLFRR